MYNNRVLGKVLDCKFVGDILDLEIRAEYEPLKVSARVWGFLQRAIKLWRMLITHTYIKTTDGNQNRDADPKYIINTKGGPD